MGIDLELLTDHKPGEMTYGPKLKPSARIERWVLRLQPFTFKVKYIPGKMVDVLSRLAEFRTEKARNVAEEYVWAIPELSVPKAMTVHEVELASKGDVELQIVRESIETFGLKCFIMFRNATIKVKSSLVIILKCVKVFGEMCK